MKQRDKVILAKVIRALNNKGIHARASICYWKIRDIELGEDSPEDCRRCEGDDYRCDSYE